MVDSTYSLKKTVSLSSKYYGIRLRSESLCSRVYDNIILAFQRKRPELENIRSSLNRFIERSSAPHSVAMERINPAKSLLDSDINSNSYKENIDWTRGRFNGQTLNIIVFNGQIVQKTFLTPKGSVIIVKRKELGIPK